MTSVIIAIVLPVIVVALVWLWKGGNEENW